MSDELATLDATAQAELIAKGEASALELVDAAIARIERLNGELNAVIADRFEKARKEAVSEQLPDGPFRGVPFLMKDLDACSAGDPFHCGMQFLKNRGFVADHDSHLYEQFRAAGFITVGKTNTPELGLSVTTEPEAYGPTRNPWNLAHSSGGSSGGSGAAVAAGLVPAAHASDGGGSIRVPASECGLVGLKPSRGRVSLGPDYGEYWGGLVISNVVTRSVRDTAAILDCVSARQVGDPYVAPAPSGPYAGEVGRQPGRLRVGVVTAMPGGQGSIAPECVAAVDAAARALEARGHIVEVAHPAALDEMMDTVLNFQVVVSSWVASAVDEWTRIVGEAPGDDELEAGTRDLAEQGRAVSAPDYIGTFKWIAGYTRRMSSWFRAAGHEGFDVLVTPTLACPPPEIGYLRGGGDPGVALERVLSVIPFTVPFNLTGQPAMSVPLHVSDAGLPIGVQLVADHGREDVLIRLAAQLEQAAPWAARRPPLHA